MGLRKGIIIPVVMLIAALAMFCRPKGGDSASSADRTSAQRLSTYIDSCWNAQNSAAFKSVSTLDFERNLNGISIAKNQSEMEAHMQVFFTAFPDLKITVENSVRKASTIFMHWQATGTNTGVFAEIAATGKKVRINGLSHLYFNEEGKLYKEVVYFNELDLLQQLGYILTPPNME